MQLSPGTVFANDYEVVRELSAGGMGTVYVVLQRSTGKQRALKLMLPQLVSDPSLRKRFEQEARVAALIESDHVVEVVGAGVDEASGAPWLAMELLRGEEISARMVAESGQPLATTHAILRQICHAVGAAHAAGIVHRDLKPENVFLAESKRAGEQRTVKVLDFGIAKIAAEASTQHTAALGSPIWMAPEQSDKGTITPAADVWSLGLITYHLLTGKYFWLSAERPESSIHQVMREVLFDPIPPASERAAEQGVAALLPPWFDAWFGFAVHRDPTQRFPDARAAFTSFEAHAGGVMSSLAPSAPRLQSVAPAAARIITPSGASPTALGIGRTASALTMEHAPPAPKRARGRWVVALVGLAAMAMLTRAAWHKRFAPRNDVRAPVPTVVASEAPTSSGDTPTDPSPVVPPLAVVASTEKPHKSRKLAPSPSVMTLASPQSTAAAVPPELNAAMESVASVKPPPPSNEGGFDRIGAIERVNQIDLSSCALPDGPRGGGRATVIFDTDGSVRDVIIETESMKHTAAGRCIERRIRGVRVAGFTGNSRSVSRAFFLTPR